MPHLQGRTPLPPWCSRCGGQERELAVVKSEAELGAGAAEVHAGKGRDAEGSDKGVAWNLQNQTCVIGKGGAP